MIKKTHSEFDESYFKKLLENNSRYFDQQLKNDFNPPIECFVKSENLGRLVVNQSDVINWLEHKKKNI